MRSDSDSAPAPSIRLSVLGTFSLTRDGQAVPTLAMEAQHLLGLLALRGRAVTRRSLAGTLWPESTEAHAHASLRSALFRLSGAAQDAVVVSDVDVRLSDAVVVDLDEARRLAHDLVAADSAALPRSSAHAIEVLSRDCLPDWYEDWVLVEAEEWRQLRLHALDALAVRLAAAGRYAEALGAALAAVRADPLRETAWATVMRIHIAEGNPSEAIRAFRQCERLLASELGITPTPALRALTEFPGAVEPSEAPEDRPRL